MTNDAATPTLESLAAGLNVARNLDDVAMATAVVGEAIKQGFTARDLVIAAGDLDD